ncbi:MAG: class I SAM-dependent methyltransferase [Bryobacteraceae bacterium]
METRNSHGLDQFCSLMEERPGLSLLDLAGASQETVTFITNQGHRLYSDDFLLQMDHCFGDGDFYENQNNPSKVAKFLDSALDFPEGHFDGALVWDRLQFLTAPLLEAVTGRLFRILRPESTLLALFHADEQSDIPTYSYRIMDRRTIMLAPRGRRSPAQFFNNRSLEKLFQDFNSVKFFLTRDHLREVIVRR